MKLIIDIDDAIYKRCKRGEILLIKERVAVENAIANSVPLNKLRAELHATAELHDDGDYYLRDEWIDEIFDKYKSESGE